MRSKRLLSFSLSFHKYTQLTETDFNQQEKHQYRNNTNLIPLESKFTLYNRNVQYYDDNKLRGDVGNTRRLHAQVNSNYTRLYTFRSFATTKTKRTCLQNALTLGPTIRAHVVPRLFEEFCQQLLVRIRHLETLTNDEFIYCGPEQLFLFRQAFTPQNEAIRRNKLCCDKTVKGISSVGGIDKK